MGSGNSGRSCLDCISSSNANINRGGSNIIIISSSKSINGGNSGEGRDGRNGKDGSNSREGSTAMAAMAVAAAMAMTACDNMEGRGSSTKAAAPATRAAMAATVGRAVMVATMAKAATAVTKAIAATEILCFYWGYRQCITAVAAILVVGRHCISHDGISLHAWWPALQWVDAIEFCNKTYLK